MEKSCPKCNNVMIHTGRIPTNRKQFENLSLIDSVTDILYLLTCKNCGYCETWIPDFLINDFRKEVRLHEQNPERQYHDHINDGF